MKKEIRTNNKGFSLVELIVVVAIMAVLMVVLAPAMLRYVEKTRIQKDDSAAGEVREALDLALADETIYSAVSGSDTIKVTIDGGTGEISVTGDSTGSDVLNDIGKTVGYVSGNKPGIKISSKDRKKKDCEITATYSSTRQAYIISDINWVGATP